MKTTNKHFELFKKECEYWKRKLELPYKIHYEHKGTDEAIHSCVYIDIKGCVARIELNTDWSMVGVTKIDDSIKEAAKHEMIHLLLGRLSEYALSRDYTGDNCLEAEEELVRKLEEIL